VPLLLYQRSGLQWLVRKSGVTRWLPKRLAAMEALLPEVPAGAFKKQSSFFTAAAPRRKRVGMLAGCVQRVFFPHVNEATARVLAAEGCDVVIARGQPCCGALMVHSGLEEEAAALARAMIAAFEEADVETIVINSAGCGSTMKEYGHLLRNDPMWSERAAAFSAKCKDISEVLSELEPRAERRPLKMRAAYHDACHLQHAQNVREQPRRLLAGIPQLEIAEIPESSLCCGSAGVFNLLQPETAAELGARKVDNLISTGAEAVVSANPGCLLQLMNGLRARGLKTMPAFHMVELLDASMRGVAVEDLLRRG
jgi:glycolate oxidase iron-sulfur subunit